jgi:hypothetical protein
MSLLQSMKLVAFCGVGFACAAPMLNLWRAGVVDGGTTRGLLSVALFEAVVVPLVWVGLSFILIRRSGWRDKLIAALLLCSVAVALGFAVYSLIAYTIPAYGNPHVPPEERVGLASLALHLMAILALSAAPLFLSLRLMRTARPARAGRPRIASRCDREGSPVASD